MGIWQQRGRADEMPRSAALTGGALGRAEMKWGGGGWAGLAEEGGQSFFPRSTEAEWSLPGDERNSGATKATLSINGFV